MAKIESIARESRVFPPPPAFVSQANIGKAEFDRLNAAAAADFSGFWAKLARDELVWHKPFTKSLDESNAPFYKWFEDGMLNVSYNCLERNLQNGNANKVAILFEADDGEVKLAIDWSNPWWQGIFGPMRTKNAMKGYADRFEKTVEDAGGEVVDRKDK